MTKSPKIDPEQNTEPHNEINSASELADESTVVGFRPSKTLLAALAILSLTLGTAAYAAYTLWSLSDYQPSSEEATI